jgi:hypothetical protein
MMSLVDILETHQHRLAVQHEIPLTVEETRLNGLNHGRRWVWAHVCTYKCTYEQSNESIRLYSASTHHMLSTEHYSAIWGGPEHAWRGGETR